MSGSVNKVVLGDLYASGLSIPDIADVVGWPRSRVRTHLIREGVALRTRTEGVRRASYKIGRALKGRKRPPMSAAQRKRMSDARLAWASANAKGVSLKPSGYLEYTRGPHKGRPVHVVAMEERLGRRIKPDECVHHIDGNKVNNDMNNLALVTTSGHTRLHRFEEKLAGKKRERKSNGRFG